MKLTFKAKRNIGLVVTTIVLIVAIILIVYFVQKNELDGRIKSGAINETVSTAQADVLVKDLSILQDYGEVTAKEGKCFLLVEVEITARKKLTLSSADFEIKDAANVTLGYTGSNGKGFVVDEAATVLKKGESYTFKILFEADKNRVDSYFLYALGAKIDLGGTVTEGL